MQVQTPVSPEDFALLQSQISTELTSESPKDPVLLKSPELSEVITSQDLFPVTDSGSSSNLTVDLPVVSHIATPVPLVNGTADTSQTHDDGRTGSMSRCGSLDVTGSKSKVVTRLTARRSTRASSQSAPADTVDADVSKTSTTPVDMSGTPRRMATRSRSSNRTSTTTGGGLEASSSSSSSAGMVDIHAVARGGTGPHRTPVKSLTPSVANHNPETESTPTTVRKSARRVLRHSSPGEGVCSTVTPMTLRNNAAGVPAPVVDGESPSSVSTTGSAIGLRSRSGRLIRTSSCSPAVKVSTTTTTPVKRTTTTVKQTGGGAAAGTHDQYSVVQSNVSTDLVHNTVNCQLDSSDVTQH